MGAAGAVGEIKPDRASGRIVRVARGDPGCSRSRHARSIARVRW